MIGAELELPWLTKWSYQTRIGLRGGYGFSTRDRFMVKKCHDDAAVSCSRARTEVYIALTLYQLLRLQFAFALYPPMRDLPWDYAINPRLGVEFDSP
jgi:hypothetical protein